MQVGLRDERARCNALLELAGVTFLHEHALCELAALGAADNVTVMTALKEVSSVYTAHVWRRVIGCGGEAIVAGQRLIGRETWLELANKRGCG